MQGLTDAVQVQAQFSPLSSSDEKLLTNSEKSNQNKQWTKLSILSIASTISIEFCSFWSFYVNISRIECIHTFFYKNKLYKNTQAETCPKIKNRLRTITRLKFWSEKFKKFI